jgi:hypothetical protein
MATNPQIKVDVLRPPKAPNLLIAPVKYTQQYQDQMNNALRLYFNQIDNLSFGISGNLGGSFFSYPYISASYNQDQYATAANTATIVKWNTLESGSGFTLNSDNTASAAVAGIYKITYSLQFANNDNAIHDSIVWLRVNGTDVTNSSTIFTLQARKSALLPNFVCGYSEVVFTLNSGDTLGLWWGTDQAATSGGATGNYIHHKDAQTSPMAYPAVPSAIGSITFISALPRTTQ